MIEGKALTLRQFFAVAVFACFFFVGFFFLRARAREGFIVSLEKRNPFVFQIFFFQSTSYSDCAADQSGLPGPTRSPGSPGPPGRGGSAPAERGAPAPPRRAGCRSPCEPRATRSGGESIEFDEFVIIILHFFFAREEHVRRSQRTTCLLPAACKGSGISPSKQIWTWGQNACVR